VKIKAKEETGMKQAASRAKLQVGVVLGLLFNTKDCGDTCWLIPQVRTDHNHR
jgi:hypothetical protein